MARGACEPGKKITMKRINVIPAPASISASAGVFTLNPSTVIQAGAGALSVATMLQGLLQPATGWRLGLEEVSGNDVGENTILLTTAGADATLGGEGYELEVSGRSMVIRAPHPAGLFYGVQTLRQLLPPEIEAGTVQAGMAWSVPAVLIRDLPRFKWRGSMLDVSRYFYPVEFIKRFIDLMALHKMNVFHWHLVDDQGWRIEIKKYPRLTAIGSQRESTPVVGDRNKADGRPYGGFYTQEQISEVVAYAAGRFVTVVPEIEMPGHSMAALASYPELGCTGGPYKVRTFWGIEDEVYCAGNEKVYAFVEDILDEVLKLFPGEFVHIGGDECPKTRWKACPQCQAMISKLGLADEHELQSHFVRHMETFLNSRGRRLIGWDEILEGGLAPNAAVMSWRGMEGGIQAAREKHEVVMTPMSHCYLDFYQSADPKSEPEAIGNCLPLEQVYTFEPVPAALTPEEGKYVLGAQCNVWTEYMPTPRQVEYMTYPRASALSEIMWSPAAPRDFTEFKTRLSSLLLRLKQLNVNYRDPG